MKATDIKEPGFYWRLVDTDWEVIEVWINNSELQFEEIGSEMPIYPENILGEVIGPITPPEKH